MIDTKALRQKILDMAIRGKLVPQDPNDEPASVLLERIRAEKQQLIKEGKIKKDKNDSVIFKGDDNRYYENLPCGWSVSTLSQVTSSQLLNDGDWILSENMDPNGNVKLIQLGSIGLMRYIDKGFKYLTEDTFHKLSCTQIFPGYMLINRIISDKMYACILPQLEGKLITTVDTCWIAPKDEWYNLKYLMCFISSTVFQSIVLHVSSGTTRKRISKSDLIHLPIYLPPLSEQQRIVSRVDELFEQVDIIEKNQADIDALYDEFRKRTLTLAIQGKLVPQDPNDEPASVLIERIRAEKKAKLGKKYVDSYIYKGDDNCYYEHIAGREQDELVDVPFDIPDNWVWRRIDGVAFLQSGKPFEELEAGTPYVKVSDMNLPENNTEITTSKHYCKATRRDIISQNSIIFPKRGGAISTNKKRKVLSFNCCIDLNTMCMTPFLPQMLEYLFAWFLTIDLGMIHDGTSVPQINNVDIYPLFVPIPPLAEQKRIVAKINDIFAML